MTFLIGDKVRVKADGRIGEITTRSGFIPHPHRKGAWSNRLTRRHTVEFDIGEPISCYSGEIEPVPNVGNGDK